MEKPIILQQQTIAQTRIFQVEQLHLRFTNGLEVQYERLRSSPHGAVLVVPMLDEHTVFLIREYAAGVDRYELGLPKGRIEAGESPTAAANREIMEEIGYGARQLKFLTSYTLAPAYLGHVTHVVLAEDLYPQKQAGDEPEEPEVVPWKLTQLNELFSRADFTEARSIAALYYIRDYMAERRKL